MLHTRTVEVRVTTRTLAVNPTHIISAALREHADVAEHAILGYTDAVTRRGPNRPRLIQLATWLAGEHAKQALGLPSEWNQGTWLSRADEAEVPCGTVACAAGHIFLEDGGLPRAVDFGQLDWTAAPVGYDWSKGVIGDEEVNVSEYAREALGLTVEQADRLFDGGNDYARMLAHIGDLLELTDPADWQPAPVPDAFPVDGSTTTTLEPVVDTPLDSLEERMAERAQRPLRRRADGQLVRAKVVQTGGLVDKVCTGGVGCELCFEPVDATGVTVTQDGTTQSVQLTNPIAEF